MNISTQQVRTVLSYILVFLFGILVAAGGYWAWQEKERGELLQSEEAVMEALSAMIVLPEELPSIATVTDKEALDSQPFFQQAENGDKVIIFKESKRAYLFRPSDRKIIDMTVITVSNPSSQDVPVFQTNDQ